MVEKQAPHKSDNESTAQNFDSSNKEIMCFEGLLPFSSIEKGMFPSKNFSGLFEEQFSKVSKTLTHFAH